ncbi:MAG: Energy-coupling factor transporter ATP-binding protein EcfA2 [Actinomycetia bacterium]|nr:Energy-coupling factor transporter ATP-binding protein EcfA2 [Actinomycetes bacterium]
MRPPRPFQLLLPLLGLAICGLVGCGGSGAAGTAASGAQLACPRIGIPAYLDLSSTASGTGAAPLLGAGRVLGFAVLNPASGPGISPDAGYRAAITQLGRRSVAIVGYVDTDYGLRPAAQVLVDVARWDSWYGVDSIFFDRTPTSTDAYATYERYVRAVHGNGGRALLNPGTYPARSYLRLADVTVTFEGTYAAYRRARPPKWANTLDPARSWHLVYATPAADLGAALATARARRAGFVYVTDDELPDPWNTIAGYWTDEQRRVTKLVPNCREPAAWVTR